MHALVGGGIDAPAGIGKHQPSFMHSFIRSDRHQFHAQFDAQFQAPVSGVGPKHSGAAFCPIL